MTKRAGPEGSGPLAFDVGGGAGSFGEGVGHSEH